MTHTAAEVIVSPSYGLIQQKRRDEALQRQKHARHLQMQLNRLASTAATEQDNAEAAMNSQTQAAAESNTESLSISDTTCNSTAVSDEVMQPVDQPIQRNIRSRRGNKGRQKQSASTASWEQGESARQFWSHQLQQPEWMTDIPSNLVSDWLVLPRPAGPRCLVITARGSTVIRSRAGTVMLICQTALPDGSPASMATARDMCILDAVWHDPNSTLYILDLLMWKGYAMNDCSAEFRAYWLQSKWAEDSNMAALLTNPPPSSSSIQPENIIMESQHVEQDVCVDGTPGTQDVSMDEVATGRSRAKHNQKSVIQRAGWVRVIPLVPQLADAAGLQAAYAGNVPIPGSPGGIHMKEFQQDGMLFFHKDSQYHSGSTSPLVLSFKDAGCSSWPVDTDAQGNIQQYQQIILVYRMDCTVATGDDPPVVLATMPVAWVQAMGPKLLRPGMMLRFSLKEGGITWAADGRPAGADLRYEGPAGQKRGRADMFSKILFQHMARTRPLTIQDLLAAVS